MKVISLLSFAFSLFIVRPVSAQSCVPEAADAFYSKAMKEINPKYTRWVQNVATDIRSEKTSIDDVPGMATTFGEPAKLGDGDIKALTFLVMMEAAKSAREDLKAIMDDVKRIIAEKKALRDALNYIKKKQAEQKNLLRDEYDSLRRLLVTAPAPANTDGISRKLITVTPAEIDSLEDLLRNQRDSLSEQSELQQLKMQMIMDRMTKADCAASNALKKFSETASSIIQNMK